METKVTCRVGEIDPAAKAWLMRLVGHDLPADQSVIVTLPDYETVATDDQWKAAWTGIRRMLDKTAANMKNVPDEEFDAAVDEAMHAARSGRAP